MFNREKLNFLQKWWLVIDKKILAIFFLFLLFSCVFIFSSSVSVANRLEIENYYFFKHQIFFVSICIFATLIISLCNSRLAKKMIPFFFTISVILLVMVFFFGFKTKGSKRWLHFLGFSLQPTEILKPFFTLFSAYLLSKFQNTGNGKYITVNVFLYIFCIYFIYKQPDIGTLILLTSVFFTQAFLLKIVNLRYCIYMIIMFVLMFITSYYSLPHVANRVDSFLASVENPDKANYQVKRSINAYSNSGFFGKGFMEGDVKNFIPDVHTDFIFPAITEEFGFVFVLMIISLYFYIAIRVLLKANRKNLFEYMAMYGLALLFLAQTSINICVSLNLLPTKGMTIPFLSYGGSSLLGTAVIFGFLLVFTKKRFDYIPNCKRILILRSVLLS